MEEVNDGMPFSVSFDISIYLFIYFIARPREKPDGGNGFANYYYSARMLISVASRSRNER